MIAPCSQAAGGPHREAARVPQDVQHAVEMLHGIGNGFLGDAEEMPGHLCIVYLHPGGIYQC